MGLKLYAIGLAQYLVYPTLALLAWPLVEDRDRARLVWAFVALGVLVAVSIFLEVAGVEFAEAVRSARRHGGATGSYLHAAIFLGTTAVLALGALFARWSPRNALLTVAAVGVMVAGMASHTAAAGSGSRPSGRWSCSSRFAAATASGWWESTIAATAVGLALSSAFGPNVDQLASRTSAGASVEGDPGNAKRIREMKETINEYRALPVAQKAFGKGLASTGNAGKLASQEPDPTESYPLKLLVETGAAGLLLIGGVLIWALVRFARTSWASVDPLLKGVGAAGIGLFAESIIYPTLEVQLIALTWWLLLVVCLKDPAPTAPIRPSQPRRAVATACPDREFAKIGEPMNRLKLIAALVLSLALVGGLVLSLLDGDETQGTQTGGRDVHEEFFGIVQGIRLDRRRTSRRWQQTGVRSTASCSSGIRCSRSRAPSSGALPTRSSAPSPRTESGRFRSCGGPRRGWRAPTLAPRSTDSRTCRRGRTSSRRRWRATDAAAATGPRSTASATEPEAKPLPIQSWQIWNEPNLSKYFAPEPSVERVRPAAGNLPRGDQASRIPRPGSSSRECPATGTSTPGTSSTASTRSAGIKDRFDAAALHPYAPNLEQLRRRSSDSAR